MTILTIIRSHCKLHGLNVPSSVMGSTDTTIIQLLEIANEMVEEMLEESQFQAVTREATFVMQASESQGSIHDLAPNGYMWAHTQTFYDRTLRRKLYGPLTDSEWQAVKALPNPGPFYKFRLRGDELLINPIPTAPLSTVAFEYASCYGVESSGGVAKKTFTDDSDVPVLPERILKRAIAFRWKQIKGLPYQADESQYYDMLNRHIARDKVPRTYNLAEPNEPTVKPGVFVPSGNWPIS